METTFDRLFAGFDAVLQSFIAGFPVLMAHSAVTFVILGVGVALYMRITPMDELNLIRAGNNAASLSLGGAIVGLALPLAFCLASSVSVYDILLWGVVTLVMQLIAFRIVDLVLKDVPDRIEAGEVGASILLVSVKIATAAVNSAAVTG